MGDQPNSGLPPIPWIIAEADAQKLGANIASLKLEYDSVKRDLMKNVLKSLDQKLENLRKSAKGAREDQRTASESLALNNSVFQLSIQCTPAPVLLKIEAQRSITR